MEANELFIPEFGDKDPMRVAMEFQKAIAGADPEVGDRIAAFGSEVLSEVEKIDGEKKLTIQTLRVYVTDQPLAEDNQVHGEMIYGDGDNLLSFIFGGFQYLRTDTFRGFCLAMDEPFIWQTDELKDYAASYPDLPLFAPISAVVSLQAA